jgi:hypothetical protein
MIPRVIDARHAGGYRVWLRFQDDLTGEIDLQSELWGPVFEPLKDVREFAKLRADPELQTLAWENGADLAPEYLYERVLQAKRSAAE